MNELLASVTILVTAICVAAGIAAIMAVAATMLSARISEQERKDGRYDD